MGDAHFLTMKHIFLTLGSTCLLFVTTVLAMTTPTPPKTLKLYYGDFPFWRAECIRMALFIGGIDYEDVRGTRDDMKQWKDDGKLPFGGVPVLEIDDGQILSQTQAIAVYTANLAGLQPPKDDLWACAKIDECLNGCTDVTTTVSKTFSISDEQEKITTRQDLLKKEGGRLYMHLNGLEQICASNRSSDFAVGSTLTVADLAIWRLVGWIDGGVLDGIPSDFVASTFPSLTKLVKAVDANPKVQEWKVKYAKFYDKKKE